ncbi:MAG: PAS domain S-box protein [Bryobacteraceae bacterium]
MKNFAGIYAIALLSVLLATIIRYLIDPYVGERAAFATYYVAVILAAWQGGMGPALVALGLGGFLASYLFVGPIGTPGFQNLPEILGFSVYLAGGFFIAYITEAQRRAFRERALLAALAEERLRQLEKEYQDRQREKRRVEVILTSIGDAVIAADTAGRVEFMNPVAQSLTGWSESEAYGQPLETVFHIVNDETGTRVESPVSKVLREGKIVGLANHTLLIAKEGRGIPIDDSGAPIREEAASINGVVLVFRDVTERKLAEAALRESEARFRRIADSNLIGIAFWDMPGVVREANDAYLMLAGRTREELASNGGFSWADLPPPELRERDEEAIREALRTGASNVYETEYVHRDGKRVPVMAGLAPVGESVGKWVAVVIDISERKKLEAQLLHAAKLESLGVLAGGIAHDFNNLLTGILGNASLLQQEVPEHSAAGVLVHNVIGAGERAAKLTAQMLAYSGRGRFVIEPLDFSRQVSEITALLGASLPKNVQLGLDLASDLPLVEADAGQVQQLVMNLVINGAEAIGPEGGMVEIATREEQIEDGGLPAFPGGETLRAGRYVVLDVHDSGHGMDEATQAKIFDPFFTTKFTGRGLGLAAVLGIVRGHKGAIRVSSSPGSGSTFRVLFPASGHSAAVEAPAAVESLFGHGTILVVDDEEVIRRTARNALEKYRYTVVEATNGREAVELFEKEPDRFAAILLDMTMPVMGGEQALKHLRAIRPSIRVLASSGYSAMEAVKQFGQGLAGFVQKPYTAESLARSVKAALR